MVFTPANPRVKQGVIKTPFCLINDYEFHHHQEAKKVCACNGFIPEFASSLTELRYNGDACACGTAAVARSPPPWTGAPRWPQERSSAPAVPARSSRKAAAALQILRLLRAAKESPDVAADRSPLSVVLAAKETAFGWGTCSSSRPDRVSRVRRTFRAFQANRACLSIHW